MIKLNKSKLNKLNNIIDKKYMLILIMLLLFYMVGNISAADITLTNETIGGLSKAINDSNDSDNIYLDDGLYYGENNSNLFVNKSLSIIGNGSNVIIQGYNDLRLFNISEYGRLTLINLIIQNSNASDQYGPIYNQGNNLQILNCKFLNNIATIGGGAIYNDGGENISIVNSLFINNYAFNGGAISNMVGNNLNINNSTFINNTADSRGIVTNFGNNFTVNNSIFNNNQVGGWGGSIYISAYNSTVMNSIFFNNTAEQGGAFFAYAGSFLKVINSQFINNSASMYGGAFFIQASFTGFFIDSSSFMDNNAILSGGAISNGGDNFTIISSIFNRNIVIDDTGDGGAIWGEGSNFNVDKSIFINNSASLGSAISQNGPGFLLNNSTLHGNQARYRDGGAIYALGSNVKVNNSIISYNLGTGIVFAGKDFVFNSNIFNYNDIAFDVKETFLEKGNISYNVFYGNLKSFVSDSNVKNVLANYNYWGVNNFHNPNPYQITINNFYIAKVSNISPLNKSNKGDIIKFNYTLKLNTNEKGDNNLLPSFNNTILLNNKVYELFDGRFNKQLSVKLLKSGTNKIDLLAVNNLVIASFTLKNPEKTNIKYILKKKNVGSFTKRLYIIGNLGKKSGSKLFYFKVPKYLNIVKLSFKKTPGIYNSKSRTITIIALNLPYLNNSWKNVGLIYIVYKKQ